MDTYDDIRLHRVSTAEQVARGLTEKIMRGEVEAGEPLRESAMAASLGISRNTVREAIRLLEQSGLVRHELHRGTVVIEPSVDDLIELYHTRMRLEVAAVTGTPTAEGIASLQDAFTVFGHAAQRGDALEIVRADLAFHAAIVALLGSKRIDAFYAQLVRELQFFLMVLTVEDREYERPDFVIEEHQGIFDAILAGDTERAVEAVNTHIDRNMRRLTAILANRTMTARPRHDLGQRT